MPRDRQLWAAFLVMGLLNNVIPFSLIVRAQARIPSGLASILNATTPFFGIVLAHMLTRDEKLTRARLVGVLVGLAGAVLVVGPQFLEHLGVNALSQLAVLGAALSYAFAGIYGRRFGRPGLTPHATAAGQVTASAVVLIPVALLAERPWRLPVPAPNMWLSVLGIAMLSTALAYVIYFRILATAGATNLLLVTFLIPVSAILLGTTILGEVLAPAHLAGMALIGLGLAAIDGRLPDLVRRRLAVGAGAVPHSCNKRRRVGR